MPHGLAIYLDVVYNHFGPEANYLGEFGPYFTDRYKTPWGAAVNYDRAGCDAVRDFVLDNVRMWLEEFHFDGLRLDAADTIFDLGARHILRAIKEVAEAAGERRGWPAIVTAESDLNDPRLLYPADRGGYGLDAQWMDDYHHAAHAFLTGERHGYYVDFGEAEQLAKVLEQPLPVRLGLQPVPGPQARCSCRGPRRRPIRRLPAEPRPGRQSRQRRPARARSMSRRPSSGWPPAFSCCRPTCRSCSWAKNTARKTRSPSSARSATRSSCRPCARAGDRSSSAYDRQSEVPDPRREATFASARLSWSWPEGTPRAGLRRLYRDLLAARREWPALRDFVNRSARPARRTRNGSPVLELVRATRRRPGRSGPSSTSATGRTPLPGGSPTGWRPTVQLGSRGLQWRSRATRSHQ